MSETLTADVHAIRTEVDQRQRMCTAADHELGPTALPGTDLEKVKTRAEKWFEKFLDK
jgi:hypothetical protein